MINEESLLNARENHDIEYFVGVRIDNEIVREVRSLDFNDVSSYNAERQLQESINNYLTDEIVASEEDYYDRHSEDIQ